MGGQPKNQTTTGTNKSTTYSSGTSSGTGSTTSNLQSDVTLPDYLQPLVTGLPGMTADQLAGMSGDVSGFQIDPAAYQAAHSTAAGDYLYGGPAQQAFVDAAMRAALPGINSAFRGGRGLSEVALGQAGIDAYAGLYDQERNRQLQAAQMLPQFQQLPLQLKNMLLQNTLSVPNAFQTLFGKAATGAGTSAQQSQEQSVQRTKGTTTQTTPLYQPGPLDYALTGIGLLGSFV